MPQAPDWKQFLDAGAQFVAVRRADARRRARELVEQGQLAQEQVQAFVDDLVEESRRRTDEMLEVMRKEIQRQVQTLGIATKDDLARLETRLTGKTRGRADAKKATKKASPRKAPVTKAGARKAGSAKKATARKAAPRKAAKKSTRSATTSAARRAGSGA